MAKKYLIIPVLLAFALKLSAQSYKLNVRTEAYAELTSPNMLSNNDPWDDEIWQINMPFPFTFYGDSYTKLYVSDGYAYVTEDGEDYIGVFDNDLIDAGFISSQSPVAYKISGSAPNRILKVEWKNAHFYEDDTEEDYANFQLWIYEDKGKIEMHYGSASVKDSASYLPGYTGASVFLEDSSGIKFIGLAGDSANPTANTNPLTHTGMNGYPAENTVYEFSVETGTGVRPDLAKFNVKAFPNPLQEMLVVELPFQGTKRIIILDVAGRKVAEATTEEEMLMLSVASFSKGAYLLKVATVDEEKQLKLIK